MPTHRWREIKGTLPKTRQRRVEKIKDSIRAEIIEQDLRGIREAAGKTQNQVAALLAKSQGHVSTIEAGADHRISTLRAYVEALGGQLEVIANFGDRRVRLKSA